MIKLFFTLVFCLKILLGQAQNFNNASAAFSGAANASSSSVPTLSSHYSVEQFNKLVNAGNAMQNAAETKIAELENRVLSLSTENRNLQSRLDANVRENEQSQAVVVRTLRPNTVSNEVEPTEQTLKPLSLQASIIAFVSDNILLVLIALGGVYYIYKRKEEGKSLF